MDANEKITKAFFELLTIKDFQDINVSELCHLANVHRTTFYAYYDNMYDLLEKAKEYAVSKFESEMVVKSNIEDYLSMAVLVPYLEFIKKYANLYKAYLLNSNVFESKKDFEYIYNQYFLKDALSKNKVVDEWEIRKITEFFIDGITGLIKSWLEGGCKESSERIAKIIVDIRNINQ